MVERAAKIERDTRGSRQFSRSVWSYAGVRVYFFSLVWNDGSWLTFFFSFRKYDKLQEQAEKSGDSALAKEIAALEKELNAKEEEINAVVSLYQEVSEQFAAVERRPTGRRRLIALQMVCRIINFT